jgi:elongation factor G
VIEAAAEADDSLIEKYLEGEEITNERSRRLFARVLSREPIVPMLCGTAFKNKGVQPMLDAVIEYLPSPTDVGAVPGHNPDTGEDDSREPLDSAPFSALAFKLMNDPHVGNLTFFRVYSGTLTKGSYVFNASKGKKERISRVLQMHANKREEIDIVYAGDIAAAVGLSDTTTGDTLADEKAPILLESITFPEPVIEMSIEPRPRPTRTRWAVLCSAFGGRPDVPDAHRPGDGPDDHPGLWANCT